MRVVESQIAADARPGRLGAAPAAGRRRGRGARYDIDASRRQNPEPDPRRTPPPMTTITESAVIDALRTVQEPELGRDIVTLDMVKNVAIDGTRRRVHDRAHDAGLSAQGRDRGQRPGRARRDRRRPASTSPGAPWSAGRSRARPSSSSRASRTSSPSRRARAASARARSASTSRWRSPRPAPRSACSTATSPARTSR